MRRSHPSLHAATFVAALVLLAHRADAVDGVIEINEPRALAGNVTPTDAPGYPITIDASGSYRLTGNMTVAGDVAAIHVVAAQNVTIDLNGFTLQGPTNCSGIPATSCMPSGTARGIDASARQSVTIRNGIIRGFAGGGLIAGPRASIDGVVASSNGSNGIQVGNGSVVKTCRASQNGGNGLDGAVAVVIESSTADANGQNGIRTSSAAVVADCTATSNGGDGIAVFEGSSVRASAVRSNSNNGISSSGACLVIANTASNNSGPGLLLGSGTGYLQNVLVENNGGDSNPQIIGGSDLGANICAGGANMNACP